MEFVDKDFLTFWVVEWFRKIYSNVELNSKFEYAEWYSTANCAVQFTSSGFQMPFKQMLQSSFCKYDFALVN